MMPVNMLVETRKNQMKKALTLLLLLCLAFTLCACSSLRASVQPTPEPTPVPTPEPTPEPTPFPEPEMAQGGTLYLNAKKLESGRLLRDGIEYLLLSEAAEALDTEVEHEADSEDYAFAWRKGRVELRGNSGSASYLDKTRELSSPPLPCHGGADLYVPVEDFCKAAEIGCFFDEEEDTVYCTPATGDWAIAENYVVPVMMYHELGWAPEGANLFVDPSSMEEQLQYLNDHGYTTIWFEDLWHVEDFEKPVILVFDDGYKSMYSILLPLLEKYQAKAEVAVVQEYSEITGGMQMDMDEVIALDESARTMLSSHGVHHYNVGEWGVDYDAELRDSALWLTRLTKKEPLSFVYPFGGSSPDSEEATRKYYRFGVKMMGPPFNTSDDPILVYRYFIERHTWIGAYEEMLKTAFNNPEVANYVPWNE